MNNENAEGETTTTKRVHDQAPSEAYAEFMKTGWISSDLSILHTMSNFLEVHIAWGEIGCGI